jgi:serine/threonine protein kinase
MKSELLLDIYRMETMLKEWPPTIVYRGVDKEKESDVVITLLNADLISAEDFLARFEPFAQALGRLDASQLAAVLDYGEHDGQAAVVQEHVDGETLAELIGDGDGLPVDLVLDLAEQVGESLKSLHQADLIHGWLHPENVVLSTEGNVRLFDAGFAQGIDLSHLLASGHLEPAPSYAPELATGEGLSPCTDFYALGAILYQALTGESPADPQNPWPGNQRAGLPPELDALVAKCLNPDPAQRIQSAAEFLAGIEEVHRGIQVGAGDTILGMEDALVGHTLGSYQLVERLGQGGMATVYKAYEPNLDRYVAIKILPQFFARDPNFMQRFRREAKAVAQLNHPNIMPIYSYGEEDDITYIAMQFVEGGTLKQGRGHVYESEEAIRLALPIVRALAYAHKRGIVHRDIKPSNVLITEDGWPVLADFGLAKMAEASGKLTGTGVGVGTPMYMSPEQGQGINVDHRTDIYSMGIMLYEMLTGDVPFRADTPMAIVIKHMTAPLPMPRKLNPEIPETLERIILKATAKEPEDRHQTAEEMVTALERVLNLVQAGRDEPLPPLEVVTPSKPAAKPEGERGAGIGKVFKTAAIALGGLIGVILLGIIMMGVFDICPPPGPWPIPPWCEGSPYQLPGVEGDEAAPTPMVTEGRLGGILFQDDFEGGISTRWQFTASEYLIPWKAEKVDGRTVMRSVPPTGGDFNSAEIRGTNWENYAIQFDFRFDQPDQFGEHYFWLRGRITDCPPTIPSLQAYSIIVTPEQVWLDKAFCENQSDQRLLQNDRDIAVDQWHTLQYIFIGNRTQVYLDGQKYLDYTDTDEPIDGGDLWIETGLQNEILFDNFRVYEIILDEEGDLAASLPTTTSETPVQDQTAESVSGEGHVLRLDGQGSYVEIPYGEDLNLDEAITLEAWIDVAFDEQQCAYGLCGFAPIISQGHGGSSMGNYTLFVYPGHVGFGFEPIDSKLIAPGQFEPGWNHIAAVHTW